MLYWEVSTGAKIRGIIAEGCAVGTVDRSVGGDSRRFRSVGCSAPVHDVQVALSVQTTNVSRVEETFGIHYFRSLLRLIVIAWRKQRFG